MAVSKKKQSSQKPSARKSAAKKSAAPEGLSTSQRALLKKLDPSYAVAIEFPVADILQESRALEAVVRKIGGVLFSGSDLDERVASSLEARRAMLETTETAWAKHRIAALPEQLRALRSEAEELKKDALAALRYFKRGDAGIQRELDALVEGSGLADLIDDLQKLSPLLDSEKKTLKKADLPKNAAARARELAEHLGGGSAERAVNTEGGDALELRNRAYWWLREAMDEVRSAGRYVFRKNPKRRSLFQASSTQARRGSKGRATAAPPSVEAAPAQDQPNGG